MLYYFLKYVLLGPFLRVIYRPRVEGLENIPSEGPAILASNHLSFSDSIFLPVVCPRKITFLAKDAYFTAPGIKGWFQKVFFKAVGQVPIDRSGGSASEAALQTGLRVLSEGKLLGIYPEGTRSPDGKLYRGKTGVARMALEAQVPVIPVAMIDTEKIQPIGSKVPRHFANMDELTESVLAYMLETSGVSIPETGSPRERIIGLLRSLRRAFAAHPNLALPNLLMQDEQATAEFVTVTLDLLAEMGLQGRDLVVAYQVLETFTVGTNAYDWGGYPDALEARRRGRRLSGHPAFDDASRSLADVEQLNDDAFEVAAAALLDAVEAMAGRKRRRK